MTSNDLNDPLTQILRARHYSTLNIANTVLYVIMPPPVGKGAVSFAFVRPTVCLSVCPSVAYIANSNTNSEFI